MCTRSKIQPSLISGLTPSIERIYVDAEFFGRFGETNLPTELYGLVWFLYLF